MSRAKVELQALITALDDSIDPKTTAQISILAQIQTNIDALKTDARADPFEIDIVESDRDITFKSNKVPDKDTRDKLKSVGFRWSKKQGLWYLPKVSPLYDTGKQLVSDLKSTLETA